MRSDEAKTFMIFNRIQFWMGIVEAGLIGLSILFEIAGATVLSFWCGVLGTGKSTTVECSLVWLF